MVTITIPKTEYQQLIKKSFRYDYLKEIIQEDIFASPPVSDGKKILKKFKETNLYNQKFLNSLEKGLNRSVFFKK